MKRASITHSSLEAFQLRHSRGRGGRSQTARRARGKWRGGRQSFRAEPETSLVNGEENGNSTEVQESTSHLNNDSIQTGTSDDVNSNVRDSTENADNSPAGEKQSTASSANGDELDAVQDKGGLSDGHGRGRRGRGKRGGLTVVTRGSMRGRGAARGAGTRGTGAATRGTGAATHGTGASTRGRGMSRGRGAANGTGISRRGRGGSRASKAHLTQGKETVEHEDIHQTTSSQTSGKVDDDKQGTHTENVPEPDKDSENVQVNKQNCTDNLITEKGASPTSKNNDVSSVVSKSVPVVRRQRARKVEPENQDKSTENETPKKKAVRRRRTASVIAQDTSANTQNVSDKTEKAVDIRANKPPESDASPRKVRKQSDTLAKIWGRKRKRRRRLSKSGDEPEIPQGDAVRPASENTTPENATPPKQAESQPSSNAVMHQLTPFQQNLTENNVQSTPVPEATHELGKRTPINIQPMDMMSYTAPPPGHLMSVSQYPEPYLNVSSRPDSHNFIHNSHNIDNQYSMQNHSGFHNAFPPLNQHLQNEPHVGYSGAYEPYGALEHSFDSNINHVYRPSNYEQSMESEMKHSGETVLANLTPHSEKPSMPDEQLKLPQKKRPLARQMVDMAMSDWEAGTMMSAEDEIVQRLDIGSMKESDVEENVHSLQTTMANNVLPVDDMAVPTTVQATDNPQVSGKPDIKTLMQMATGASSSDPKAKRTYQREYVVQCKMCQVKLKDYGYLFRHVSKLHKEHADVEAYKEEIRPLMRTPCPICGKMVSCISNISSHIRQKHSDISDRASCPLCHKTYKTAVSLRQHLRICHAPQEKRFVCNICQAKFAEKRGLTEHINCSHETTVVFNCEVCGKSFLTKGRLRRHHYIHGEFRHICRYCGKGFHLKDNMNKHIEIVHEQNKGKRFECEYCKKKFSVKGNMVQHVMSVHYKKSQYSCSLCDSGFRRKKDLLKHCEEKHPEAEMVPSPMRNTPSIASTSGSIPSRASTPTLQTPSNPEDMMHTQVLTPAML